MGHNFLGMQVKDFCKVTLARFSVNGNHVEISGKNASGKTSLLNALWMGLAGTSISKDMGISKPVKSGADIATISIDLDDLLVHREINAEGSTTKLIVATKDGHTLSAGQSLLDAFRGKLFDISAFGRMDAKKQMDLVLPIVNMGLDLGAWKQKRDKVFTDRTDINRDVKNLKSQVEGIPLDPEAPEKEVSIADIAAEQQSAQEKIAEHETVRQELKDKLTERTQCKERIETVKTGITDIEAQIAALKEKLAGESTKLANLEVELAAINTDGKAIQERVQSLPEDPDLTGYAQRIADVEKTNAGVRKQQERAQLALALAAKEQESADLTTNLEAMDAERLTAIKAANWPIEGMGVDDSGITYNGVPTSQASGGENLLMGYAVAKALSPKFNVLRLSRPDDLDDTNKALLYEMAERDGYIIVAEQVSHGEGSGLEIVDGELDGGTTEGLEKIAEIAKPKRQSKKGTAADAAAAGGDA